MADQKTASQSVINSVSSPTISNNSDAVKAGHSDLAKHSNLRYDAPVFCPSVGNPMCQTNSALSLRTDAQFLGPPTQSAILMSTANVNSQGCDSWPSTTLMTSHDSTTQAINTSAAATHTSQPCGSPAQAVCATSAAAGNEQAHSSMPVDNQQKQTQMSDMNETDIPIPSIHPEDYENDKYLRNIYMYLSRGLLTNDNKQDRITLLLSEDFFINDKGILYRISLPRGKKVSRVQSTEIRLALPQKYLAEVVRAAHNLGHFSQQRTFEFLRIRFYAKNLWDAVAGFHKTCDKCQRMKRDYNRQVDPLHPLEVPSGPFQMWSTDHFILSRPTADGFCCGIVFIDAFSKFPVIRLVKNTSALEAARVFVKDVVAIFGLSSTGRLILNSDKGSAYCSKFFKKVCELLNVRLITSAAQISTTNGLSESCIKTVKQCIKMFTDSDKYLQDAITLTEMSLRFNPHSATKISPYEVIFGRKPSWPIVNNEAADTQVSFKGDQLEYYNMISQRLAEIQAGVRENIEENKQEFTAEYNKRFKTRPPVWKIGDEVLISDKKIKPHSDQILTKPAYHGSFIITDKIENEGFGPSYRLVRTSDGRPLRHLISGSRLRAYTAPQRADFHRKYPSWPITTTAGAGTQAPAANSSNHASQPEPATASQRGSPEENETDFEPAIKILKERMKDGKREFLVLFANKQKCWADSVSPDLEKAFRIHQEQLRNKRRRRRRRY